MDSSSWIMKLVRRNLPKPWCAGVVKLKQLKKKLKKLQKLKDIHSLFRSTTPPGSLPPSPPPFTTTGSLATDPPSESPLTSAQASGSCAEVATPLTGRVRVHLMHLHGTEATDLIMPNTATVAHVKRSLCASLRPQQSPESLAVWNAEFRHLCMDADQVQDLHGPGMPISLHQWWASSASSRHGPVHQSV